MRSCFVTATSSPEGLVLHCLPEDAAQPTEPRTRSGRRNQVRQEAKSQLNRGQSPWYRHITLAMLAHAYLAATRATAERGALQPEPSSSSR